MLVVWMSRGATPSAPRAWRSRSIAWLFAASACAAVGAWVTTPVVTSAISGAADTVPTPATVTVDVRA